MKQSDKYRHEIKYLIRHDQFEVLRVNLGAVMDMDKNAGGKSYHIRSIYYDDLLDSCLKDNEDGVSPRQKWRIRNYDLNDEYFMLECKQKYHNKIKKSSCRINKDELNSLLSGQAIWGSFDRELMDVFSTIMINRCLRPKVIVGYDRIPYIWGNDSVRVTLDCNIYSSPASCGLCEDKISKRQLLSKGKYLLEVKYDEFFPDHICKAISIAGLQRVTFSKYCLCRKHAL